MGRYAEFTDVATRFEGEMPADRAAWVELRIEDAEAELIGLVPDLESAESVTADTPARAARVRRLVADKVLSLYRNPDGAVSVSNTLGPMSESRTLPGPRSQAGSWVAFTDEELIRVGYVKPPGSVSSVPLRAWYYGP